MTPGTNCQSILLEIKKNITPVSNSIDNVLSFSFTLTMKGLTLSVTVLTGCPGGCLGSLGAVMVCYIIDIYNVYEHVYCTDITLSCTHACRVSYHACIVRCMIFCCAIIINPYLINPAAKRHIGNEDKNGNEYY